VDSIVKQRLVGALILLALGVVFWPIIFVPESQQDSPVVVEVPPPPPVDLSPVPEPDNIGLRRGGQAEVQEGASADVAFTEPEPAAKATPAPLPEKAMMVAQPPVTAPLEKPTIDEDGLPIAFTLQVATMADRPRAEALRDELIRAGYKGYVKRLRRDDRVLYRVLVGPKYSRHELAPIKVAVDENWKVDSLIMRYLP
jgi:DedD protein